MKGIAVKFARYLLLSGIFLGFCSNDMKATCCKKPSVAKRTQKRKPQEAHIKVPAGLPGIIGLLAYRPETAKPLSELAQILLVNDSSLSRGERELIAAYVSSLNKCNFCCDSHSAVAEHLLGDQADLVSEVKEDLEMAPVSDKLRALLIIAKKVAKDARMVSDEDIANARSHGATDLEIHDTVLIAAAFCMYNRYVDGLGTVPAPNKEAYKEIGAMLAAQGYLNPKRK